MADTKEYVLCGGTFFVLLLKARKQRIAARRNAEGVRDGLSEQEVFEALIKIAFPNFVAPAGTSFKTYTSNYKACRLSSNEYLPFENTELVDNFDNLVQENYSEALARMSDFIKTYLADEDYGNWLVKALLEVIESDTSITDELFYIENGSQPYDKKHLLSVEKVELPSFLLGVWHFIVKNRPDNKIGVETYELWHQRPENSRAKHEFISDVGRINQRR